MTHQLAKLEKATEVTRDYYRIGERISEKLAIHYPSLTQRERLVCGFTLAGYTAEAISLILGIGTSTIITYRRRAYFRLGVSNINQLVAPLLAAGCAEQVYEFT